MNQKEITIQDWREMGLQMVWSIHNEEDRQRHQQTRFQTDEEARDDYRRTRLDLEAPEGMEDGVYGAFHRSGWRDMPERGESHGVTVQEGRFLPEPTDAAIFEAVCRSYRVDPQEAPEGRARIDHVFIEKVTHHPGNRMLEVFTGS